ncbi:MAG: integrase [Polyangiaceae bacterium]
MDDDARQKIALWRLSVLGPLISARLEHGDRRAYFRDAAARLHEHPDGRLVRVSPRTVESWYLAHRRGGFRALFPDERSDRGTSRAIQPEVAEIILKAKREKPRRSLKRIIRALERAHVVGPRELSKSSVHRLLSTHGISARPLRGPAAERRSFLHEHAGDLWIGDALHGPIVAWPSGPPRKAYLLSQIDCATRHMIHSFFAPSEGAVQQERGFRAAVDKSGLPRVYYVDLGSAYIADSLKLICAELGIRLLHAGARDAEAKGAIERWHRTWREEVEDELDDRIYTIGELSEIHAAWLAEEYEKRVHETTGRAPGAHWFAEVPHLRPVPRDKDLDEVFLHREWRTVRKDGTVRFYGRYLEVRAELSGEVELRFDPTSEDALPRVFVDDRFCCDTVLLDRFANATRKRRRNLGAPAPGVEPSGLDPLGQLVSDHRARVRPADALPSKAERDLAFRRVLESEDDDSDNETKEI